MKVTDTMVDYIMFDKEKLDMYLECGASLVETNKKGLYASRKCGAKFYGDDYKSPVII